MEQSFRSTCFACYRGYIVQGIVNNLSPLFFVIFQRDFHISYSMIASLILFNFITQIVVDILCVKFVDRIGYRSAAIIAHVCGTVGLLGLGVFPMFFPSPFLGLATATMISAVGGGIIEVIISPIIDSLPSENKEARMSLLHSFYCWGQLGVVLITTLLVKLLGESLWWLLPICWAVFPLYNLFSFFKVPLMPTVPAEEKVPLRTLGKSGIFLCAMVLMLCAGASELAMSQWSSMFAEKGLGVPKVLGDLLGPCLFALFMGAGRTIYGIWGHKLNLFHALLLTGTLCIGCYVGAACFTNPALALFCCAFCGFTISLMWPGVFSNTSAMFPKGGTAMFGILAVCGDIGCSSGPALTGFVSDIFSKFGELAASMGLSPDQLGLKAGLLSAVIFPAVLIVTLILQRKLYLKSK